MADQDHPPKPEDGPPRSDADALARLGRDLETVRERKAAENAKRRPDADPRSMRQVGKAWSLAIEMVAAVVVSLFIGWWVDRWFDTAPWGLLGFILLGVAAALWSAIRTAMLMQAQQQAEVARQDALSARAELEDMQKQFSELQAKQTERGMVLTLSDVLFDTGQATLKPGADLALDRVAEFLRENAGTRVIVEGHTDSRGSEEYNLRLSERRAQSVADALRMRGIEPGRFQVVGRGEGYPVANNATAEGRQQNRRVEIVFSDNAGRFAQGPTEDEATLR